MAQINMKKVSINISLQLQIKKGFDCLGNNIYINI